jgi:hypothetical protein
VCVCVSVCRALARLTPWMALCSRANGEVGDDPDTVVYSSKGTDGTDGTNGTNGTNGTVLRRHSWAGKGDLLGCRPRSMALEDTGWLVTFLSSPNYCRVVVVAGWCVVGSSVGLGTPSVLSRHWVDGIGRNLQGCVAGRSRVYFLTSWPRRVYSALCRVLTVCSA